MKIRNEKYTLDKKLLAMSKIFPKWLRSRIRIILIKDFDKITEADFGFLKQVWIVNWIGNFLLPGFIRKFLAKIFPFVKFELHDLGFYLWGSFYDFLNCNYWLLKYSTLDVVQYARDKRFLMFLYASIVWMPLIVVFYVIVNILGLLSFNFFKYE